jgi:hypothetical protein
MNSDFDVEAFARALIPETGNFSVMQFFADGSAERVLDQAPVNTAMSQAGQCCTSVGAQVGTTTRVVIVEDGDAIVLEWKFGEGITFPPELAGRDWLPTR